MNPIENLKSFLQDNKNKIIIFDNNIYICNYIDIKSFDENKIIISIKDKNVTINGKNITIKKLTKDEILINGNLENIEFRWYYEKYNFE